ncbi:Lactate utilization protein B [Actinomadura rubteroloni]|uniref:Lactate utilization protein B n=1 Tax=Actinomadura rubteroloni TaxID=1926885 RepID=A0A2P4UBR6_9ACTN|nr:LUD domain-containing protein [Actinomadura rubteroloni]POM22485.1 Lactate utilization protein B [Actinomadura rubteroloni]
MTPRPKFAAAARPALADTALRRALADTAADARARRAAAVAELPDWPALRAAGRAVKDRTLLNLDACLERLERAVADAGGTVHWAENAAQAARTVVRLAAGAGEVAAPAAPVLDEIGLDGALAAAGIAVHRTGAHAAFPAGARVAVTGVDFMVAETGTMVALERAGDVWRCLTVPDALITVAGLEQVVPDRADLEVLLQSVSRSAGERLAPVVSAWTGVVAGDGPAAFHLVLLDNGRTRALADEVGRAALRCVGCDACLHVCPVYERTGPEPYGAPHAGPIGAIRTPQLRGVASAANASLPFASTLCGACADVCPVEIDIPEVLVRLRGKVVDARRGRPVPTPELAMMRAAAWTLADPQRYEAALRGGTRWARLLARGGRIRRLPGRLGVWTDARDLPAPPARSFRVWWRDRGERP